MFQSQVFWTEVCFSRKLLFSPTKKSFELQHFCYTFTSSSEISNESSNSRTTDDLFTDKICFRTTLLHIDSFLFEQLENHQHRINWPQTCPKAFFDKLKAIKISLKLFEFILISFEQEVEKWKKRKNVFFFVCTNFPEDDGDSQWNSVSKIMVMKPSATFFDAIIQRVANL